MRIKTAKEQVQDRDILTRCRFNLSVYFDLLLLRNKLDINNHKELNVAEREITQRKAAGIDKNVVGACDQEHFCEIHKYLFEDIYYFAGKLRDVPMEIDSVTRFAGPDTLPGKLSSFFDKLAKDKNLKSLPKEQFVDKTAQYLTDINILHPFREGNGRTKRLFFSELARQAGYELDWAKCTKQEWKLADECAFDSSRDGNRDVTYLKILLQKAVAPTVEAKAKMTNEWAEFYASGSCMATVPPNSADKGNKNMKTAENLME